MPLHSRNRARKPAPATGGLDRTDVGILAILSKDARLSNKEIAAAVGLAPSSCHERIKALRARGVLRGAHADVDLAALGFAIEALLFVQLEKLDAGQVDKFLRDVAAVHEVRSAFLISGHFDVVVHVVAEDMAKLKLAISEHFSRRRQVLRIETSVVFDHRARYELPAPAGAVTMPRARARRGRSGARRSADEIEPAVGRIAADRRRL